MQKNQNNIEFHSHSIEILLVMQEGPVLKILPDILKIMQQIILGLKLEYFLLFLEIDQV